MDAIIFGRGPTRSLIDQVPIELFTVSCNLRYPNANIIFARDEPILEKILKEETKGFENQFVFTTLREYEKFDSSTRIMLVDEDRLWPNNQGLSTGILAIATILNFGFKKIYLCGFTFENSGGTLEKLSQIIHKNLFNKLYCIVEKPLSLSPPTPNFITREIFYKN